MAKSKKSDNEEELTFMGQTVDPEIQKKVDEYMEVDENESADIPSAKSIEIKTDLAEETLSSTAPLLPTEQLPDIAKDEESDNEIISDDSDNAEIVESETADLTIEEDVKENQDNEVVDTEYEHPVDSELIDLDNELEPEQPIESEEEIDLNKTVGEITDQAETLTDDEGLDEAISDIVAEDADKLLEVEDSSNLSLNRKQTATKKTDKGAKRDNLFKTIFTIPLYRNLLFFLLIMGLGSLFVIPSSRYFLLGTFGVKVSTSIRVLDDKTNLPLKNVEVSIGDKKTKTDDRGQAKLEKIKIGKQEIFIRKLAFAEVKKTVTLGWGSNPLGDQKLVPTGSQYVFVVKDFVSDKPVSSAEVTYGDSSAKFNEKGEATLTAIVKDVDSIEATVTGKNYRSEKVQVSSASKDKIQVKLVPSKKHVFVSKRSGKFDLYKTDIDGKNQKVILAASGIEKEESLALTTSPSQPVVAFVSTRENTRNQDGYLLSNLTLVYLEDDEIVKVTQSERIQLVGWAGNRLVYVKITQGASEANPNRHKLMSYDIESRTEKELASTNYFNDVSMANSVIYYTPAVYQVNGKVGLYKINADGTNKKTLYDKEVWNIFRTGYDKFSMSVGQDWYELNLLNDDVKKVGGAPSVLKSRVYINNQNQKQSIWVDDRDGKTVLINYDIASKADKPLISESGIRNPIYWLDEDHLVYRVSTSNETADYVMSLSGGVSIKISDVTNTVGVDRWYYF